MSGLGKALRPKAMKRSQTLAYVMNGFPRLSETFIAHEIYQLERLGMHLRLYVVKDEKEAIVHPVVSSIRAPLIYLPPVTSLSGTVLPGWLAENLHAVWRHHLRVLLPHPLRWIGALCSAVGLAWQHRIEDEQGHTRLRKVYIKEFLQAGVIAADLLRRGDVGHLHGHFCHGVATITWLASRMAGTSYSFTAHAKDIYQADLNPGLLLERKMAGARFVATCTCANAAVLRARHLRPKEVHTIYHGLDTDFFVPVASQVADKKKQAPLILAVGRFVEKKGFDQLVEACAILRDQGLSFRCMIVGENGSAQATIRTLVKDLKLSDHLRLCAPMTQDALRAVYASAHVFALPCQVMDDGDRDGFPNVLAEAMAMGIPVVSTRISGIPELIEDGIHGLLVEPRDARGLAEALRQVIENEALRKQMIASARQRICERFDSRQTTIALRNLFAAQLNQPPVAVNLAEAQA
jgi:glycosyltransferase involved in cell wall biosynthesis